MKKVDRPTGLIAYDTDINIARRAEGKAPIYRIVRPRTLIYAGIIVLVGAVMLYALLTRSHLDISVRHDRNPLFVTLSDGSIRNAHTVHLLNKRQDVSTVALDVEGLPEADVRVVGLDARRARQAADPDRSGPGPRSPCSRHHTPEMRRSSVPRRSRSAPPTSRPARPQWQPITSSPAEERCRETLRETPRPRTDGRDGRGLVQRTAYRPHGAPIPARLFRRRHRRQCRADRAGDLDDAGNRGRESLSRRDQVQR